MNISNQNINKGSNKIGCKGIKILIKIDFPLMLSLKIYDAEVRNEGFKYLAKSNWPILRGIYLSN